MRGTRAAAHLVVAPPDFQNVYWFLAGDILQSGTLGLDGVPTTRYEVLYPMVLAAMRLIVADSVFAAQVLQVLIGSLGTIWLFDLAEGLTANRRVAFIDSMLFAVNPLLVRHAGDSTDFTLHATLLIGFCARSSWRAHRRALRSRACGSDSRR